MLKTMVPHCGCVPTTKTVTKLSSISDQTKLLRCCSCSFDSHITRLLAKPTRRRFPKSKPIIIISCASSPNNAEDHEFLQASLLLSETLSHYQMRKRGFEEPRRWNSHKGSLLPLNREPRPDIDLIWRSLFHRFQSPTIFLKISCDGDFLLPISVGDFAMEKLIDGLQRDGNEDCPDQLQFIRNMVDELGCQVKLVRITKRVVNTYYSRLYFSKPGADDITSVDIRPSDAINVAIRCEAPIYVSKNLVLTDAIKYGYGVGKLRESKPTYDVLLDSATDGPCLLAKELTMMKNVNFAVREERYNDAAMWRDKLLEFRKSSQEH